jgi:hypothetical protein
VILVAWIATPRLQGRRTATADRGVPPLATQEPLFAHGFSEDQVQRSAGERAVQRGARFAGTSCLAEQGDQLGQDALSGHGLDRREVVVGQYGEISGRDAEQARL